MFCLPAFKLNTVVCFTACLDVLWCLSKCLNECFVAGPMLMNVLCNRRISARISSSSMIKGGVYRKKRKKKTPVHFRQSYCISLQCCSCVNVCCSTLPLPERTGGTFFRISRKFVTAVKSMQSTSAACLCCINRP